MQLYLPFETKLRYIASLPKLKSLISFNSKNLITYLQTT